MKSFFSTLKKECIYRQKFKTQSDLQTAIFDYIECFYNHHRRQSAIGYLSPCDFEALTLPRKVVSE